MSGWFESSNWATIAKTAKTALKHAQKNIDKVLELPEVKLDPSSEPSSDLPPDIQQPTSRPESRNGSSEPKNIQDETEGFFSLFGVSDSKKSSKTSRPSSTTSSIDGEPSRGNLKVRQDDGTSSLSRKSSASSLSRLRSADAWSTPELHAVTSHDFSDLDNGDRFDSEYPNVEDLQEPGFCAHGSTSAWAVGSSSNEPRLESVLENVPEFLPSQVPQGRLEILFQDDEPATETFVEVPLGSEAHSADLVTESKDFDSGRVFPVEDDREEAGSPDVSQNLAVSVENSVGDLGETNTKNLLDFIVVGEVIMDNAEKVSEISEEFESPAVISEVVFEGSGDLQKELEYLRAVLTTRETKLLDLSKDNAKLKEENDNLFSRITDLQASQSENDTLRQEQSEKYSQLERKLQLANEEKKSLNDQLQLTKTELSNSLRSRSDLTATQLKDALRQMEEKDQQIRELMEEGEKLSKQQFQNSSHIKKMKTKQKELETDITKLRSDLEDKTTEITTLRSTLNVAEESDQKTTSIVKQLSASVDRLEKDLLSTRNLHDESKSKISSMQAALDTAYKELSDLHRQRAVQEGNIHEAIQTKELTAKEELRLALEQQKQELLRDHENLEERVEALQGNLNRAEATLKRREEGFREEVADYQQRLQDAMVRNEELGQNLAQATRPLLRQNEALQQQMSEQTVTFDRLEQTLTRRLQEAISQLAVAQEKERSATDKLSSLMGKVDALETQISIIREERSCLATEVDMERRRNRELEEKLTSLRTEFDKNKDAGAAELLTLKREKHLLDHQLTLGRDSLEMEQRKTATLSEQVTELYRQIRTASAQAVVESIPLRRSDSVNSTTSTLDGRWSPSSQQNNSLYGVLRGGSAPYLDSVQSQLKLKEGETNHLKSELKQLEQARQKLSEDLMRAVERSQEVDLLRKEIESLQTAKEDVIRRHNAMLQMYGEKVEELQELRLDYEDMKALYKSQIDALTRSTE